MTQRNGSRGGLHCRRQRRRGCRCAIPTRFLVPSHIAETPDMPQLLMSIILLSVEIAFRLTKCANTTCRRGINYSTIRRDVVFLANLLRSCSRFWIARNTIVFPKVMSIFFARCSMDFWFVRVTVHVLSFVRQDVVPDGTPPSSSMCVLTMCHFDCRCEFLRFRDSCPRSCRERRRFEQFPSVRHVRRRRLGRHVQVE